LIWILRSALSEDYVVVINPAGGFQPKKCRNTIEIEGFSKLVTKGISIRELMVSADVIVGDYRDTFFEAALLKKPMYSTAFDYEIRVKVPNMSMNIRDFESFLFCPVIRSSKDLIDALKDVDSYDYGPMEAFAASMLDGCDGESSKRVVEYLLRERKSD
jgi:CDP-glycerol glycerophosphotransferase (TagB/SpsB family)